MAAQVLGAAVHDDIDTELDGPLVDRGGEGVVDDGDDAALASHPRDGADVQDREQRVGGALDVDELRLPRDRLGDLLRVRRHERVRDAEPLEVLRDHGVRSAVDLVLDHGVVSGAEDCEQHRGDRRHARREDQAVLGALQDAELLHHHGLVRRVEVPGVRPGLAVEVLEGRGRVDRRVDSARGRVDPPSGVDARGFRLHVVLLPAGSLGA